MAKKNTRRRSTGWAHTKRIPHYNHPAYYRKKGQDEIEYVTFTHSVEVDFDKNNKKKPIEKHDKVVTKRLHKNIDSARKGDSKYSHVVPRVYEGKRSALGKGTNEYVLDNLDKPLIDEIFANGKRYKIISKDNSGNSKRRV